MWTKGRDGEHAFPLLPNRRYIVTAVVRAKFDRLATEINLGVPFVKRLRGSSVGQHANGSRFGGLPADTWADPGSVDGWIKWDWEFVSPSNSQYHWGSLMLMVYTRFGARMPQLAIADWAVIETPTVVVPFPAGEGLSFKGGDGALVMGMRVLSCNSTSIQTRSAEYILNSESGTISVMQQIDMPRLLATWSLTASLHGLAVLAHTPDRCVIGNEHVSVGVQADGLIGFVPAAGAITTTLTTHFSSSFSRWSEGNLLIEDDWGGLTVCGLTVMLC